MYDHHVVRTVHPLGQLTGNVGDALHVAGRAHVELIRVEREHVAVEHVLSPVSLGEVFCSRHECAGSRVPCSDREPERCSAGRPVRDEPNPQPGRVSVEHVVDRRCGITRGPDIHRAHCCVLSPNEMRISSSAARTSHRSTSSTARPVRSI